MLCCRHLEVEELLVDLRVVLVQEVVERLEVLPEEVLVEAVEEHHVVEPLLEEGTLRSVPLPR